MRGIRAGDLVRIKNFEQMAKEYGGVDYGGDINMGGRIFFVDDMRHLCGFQFVVERVSECGYVTPLGSTPFLDSWTITEQMLEVLFEDVGDSAIVDSSKLRDDLILTSYEDDHFQLKVSSNYGQEINVKTLAKKVFNNMDEDIFYFEIENDYNERETQCLGLSLGKVERLAN